jgi:NitT/TauT family transport system permease protein
MLRTFPTRGVLARPARSVADVVVFLGAVALL